MTNKDALKRLGETFTSIRVSATQKLKDRQLLRICCLLWLILTILWGIYFAGYKMINYDPGWYVGTFPAVRGRLMEKTGLPLVWSERQCVLLYKKADSADTIMSDMKLLNKNLGLNASDYYSKIVSSPTNEFVVQNLTTSHLIKIKDLFANNERFIVQSYFDRQQTNLPRKVIRQIGETQQFGNREVGMSGWEKFYNKKLSGSDGKYRVKIDKFGNWKLDSWEEIKKPTPGEDVYLPINIEQISSN